MEMVTFEIPKMYADHHVLAVRETLARVSGVHEVHASAALKRVFVSYDPAATTAAAVEEALGQAGYAPGEGLEFYTFVPAKQDGSFWHTWHPRATKTNRLDLEMSGDFRKY